MAAIIDDGPRVWLVDSLNRKLGRVLATMAGAAMLVSVHLLEPGRARLALAIGATVLLAHAVRSSRAGTAATVADLAEIEAAVFDRIVRVEAGAVDVVRSTADELAALREQLDSRT